MSTMKKPIKRFKVGDWVSFQYGVRTAIAQIIEDRGPLGFNRRRLYRIQMERDGLEPDAFELPEDHLEPASAPTPDKAD